MKHRTLRTHLSVQWLFFTLVMSLVFLLCQFFFLFVLEDEFIERRLRDMALVIQQNATHISPPDGMQIYTASDVPAKIKIRLDNSPINKAVEFSSAEFGHLHALKSKSNTDRHFYVTYQAAGQGSVNEAVTPILYLMSPFLILFLAAAFLISRRFIERINANSRHLISQLSQSESPERLRHYANSQSIKEFGDLALMFAQAWQSRLDSVEAEKRNLEYLSHELRTPMQVAKTNLELINLKSNNKVPLQRLNRALNRLERVGTGILWLMKGAKDKVFKSIDVTPTIVELGEELSDVAAKKNQQITYDLTTAATLPLPCEALELIISNLLMNAIQHGSSGTIEITTNESAIIISNPISSQRSKESQGFGIGLSLIQRLAFEFGLKLGIQNVKLRMQVTLSL